MAGAVVGGIQNIYRAAGMREIKNPLGGTSAWMNTRQAPAPRPAPVQRAPTSAAPRLSYGASPDYSAVGGSSGVGRGASLPSIPTSKPSEGLAMEGLNQAFNGGSQHEPTQVTIGSPSSANPNLGSRNLPFNSIRLALRQMQMGRVY